MYNSKFLDNASTTKVHEEILQEMIPYFIEHFGNASSNHEYGSKARFAVEKARKQVAMILNADPSEIVFTSGSTEAINLGIKGFLEGNPQDGKHLITSKIEHKAVLSTFEYLESIGYEVTYLDVNPENGQISLSDLKNSIKTDTVLASFMLVNNELGTFQPIDEIGEICKDNHIVLFSDATQAVGKIPIDVQKSNIDLLCLSSHKIHGPKGVGALYIKKETELTPQIHGGNQENGLRAGTYNTPGIVGLGLACEIARVNFDINNIQTKKKRNEILDLFETNDWGKPLFNQKHVVPNIISMKLNHLDADDFLMIHRERISASIGSSCNNGLEQISYVLKETVKKEEKNNIIRISI